MDWSLVKPRSRSRSGTARDSILIIYLSESNRRWKPLWGTAPGWRSGSPRKSPSTPSRAGQTIIYLRNGERRQRRAFFTSATRARTSKSMTHLHLAQRLRSRSDTWLRYQGRRSAPQPDTTSRRHHRSSPHKGRMLKNASLGKMQFRVCCNDFRRLLALEGDKGVGV